MKQFVLFLGALFLGLNATFSQEDEMETEIENPHSLALIFSYTHIPEASRDGEEIDFITVPTIGLDYFYKISEKWMLGGAFDMELEKYEVEFEGESLKREIAIIFGAVVAYEILPKWAVFTGPGIEFEKNKTLFIFRFATEYTIKLKNNWAVFPNFTYDFKREFGSYAFGLGLRKSF